MKIEEYKKLNVDFTKAIKEFKKLNKNNYNKYFNMIILPRRKKCSICYNKIIETPFQHSLCGKPICEQCFIEILLEAEEKLKEIKEGEKL